jgi:hypothetical protein
MRLVPGTPAKHPYQTCQDEYCELPYCRIYKEGYGAGASAGYASGHADGYAAGYSAGQADAAE